MTDKKLVSTDINANIGSVSSLAEFDALWAKVKKEEPARFARLEAEGEYERQAKLLGFHKETKAEAKAEAKAEEKPAHK